MELVSKKVVVLCQEGLMRFDLGIQIPKPLNQGFFFENLNPSSRKRRRMKAMNTSDSLGIHKPSLLALLESRMSNHTNLVGNLGFSKHISSGATDHSRGIVLIWTKDLLNNTDISISSQTIHVIVQVFQDLVKQCFENSPNLT
ncbi:hypothetical protein FXO38_16888 [Capsicum annuum]|nr:hypothetical protein FXO38_16888 [Capsicum annuum]